MKTIIQSEIFGRITYDSGKKKVTIENGDLAERIEWLLRPENERLLGHRIRRDSEDNDEDKRGTAWSENHN